MNAVLKAPTTVLAWLCAVMCARHAFAVNTEPLQPTNPPSILMEYAVKHYLQTTKKDPEVEFWPAMSQEIQRRTTHTVADEIGFVPQLRLSLKLTEMRHDYISYYNESAADAIIDGIRNGGREVLAERLPVTEWEEGGKTFLERHIGPFLRGSIGNTEEERLRIVSSEPQSLSTDRAWWQDIREKDRGLLSYGARVFRTDPYLYATIGFGRVERRTVILDMRVYSLLLDDEAGNPKVRIGMIVPTGQTSHLILGCSLYPLDMGLDDDRSRGSIRYEKVIFRNHRRTTFWSVGVEANNDGALASMLVTSTW